MTNEPEWLNDPDFHRRLLDADGEAWAVFINAIAPRIRGLLKKKFYLEQPEIDEVIQDVIRTAFACKDKWDPQRSSFVQFVCSVCVLNCGRDHMRSKHHIMTKMPKTMQRTDVDFELIDSQHARPSVSSRDSDDAAEQELGQIVNRYMPKVLDEFQDDENRLILELWRIHGSHDVIQAIQSETKCGNRQAWTKLRKCQRKLDSVLRQLFN